MALFEPGEITATPNAIDFMARNGLDIIHYINRHLRGDWGDVVPFDKKANEDALITGARLFSSYEMPAGKVYIITEADRSATTVLLPEDY